MKGMYGKTLVLDNLGVNHTLKGQVYLKRSRIKKGRRSQEYNS